MNFVKCLVGAAAVAIAFGATGASASRVSNGDCIKLSTRVAQEIHSSTDTAGVAKARDEQTRAAYYCDLGSYQKGVDHYNQALALLGQK